MKVANIVPITALPLIEAHTYRLALAHIALASVPYAHFYTYGSTANPFTILDNSVFELGKPLPIPSLTTAVDSLRPSLLVVPDSIWDAEENLLLAQKFERVVPELRDFHPTLEFMVVAHGQSPKELKENLQGLLRLDYPTYIGLSKQSRRAGLRPELAQQAALEGMKVHFLGVWEDPVAETLEGKELGVVVTGLDTSYAARLGLIGRTLLEPYPTPPSLDFFADEDSYNSDWLSRQLEALRWLAESDVSSVAELEQEYKNGKF